MSIEKINISSTYGKFNVEPKKNPEVQNPQNRDDHPQVRDEDIKISEEARKLQRQESQAPIDNAKVQQIKKSIEEGTFKVNPEKIAEKMHEEAVELMRRKVQQTYQNKKGNEGVLGA